MSTSSPYIDISPTLRLLGTAHVATTSVEAVKEQIETYQPKIVGVELCKTRHDALVEGRRLDKEGLRRVIKEGKAPMVLMQAMLSAEQRKMGLHEGQEPGAELLAAVETAKEAGLEVALVDRDIQVTMRRAWRKMKWRERFRLLFSLFADEEDELQNVKAMISQESGLVDPASVEEEEEESFEDDENYCFDRIVDHHFHEGSLYLKVRYVDYDNEHVI